MRMAINEGSCHLAAADQNYFRPIYWVLSGEARMGAIT